MVVLQIGHLAVEEAEDEEEKIVEEHEEHVATWPQGRNTISLGLS